MRRRPTSRILSLVTLGTLSVGALGAGLTLPGVAWSACTTTATAFDLTTLTLPMSARAIGATSAYADGLSGLGIDVAVIDTGVNAVPGLASAGKIVDAVDLSFDANSAGLRYRDLHGHGTNMAGIIAGDGSGGAATVGIAPKARIINVKVGAGDGSVDASQIIAALDWVVQNRNTNGRKIRIVSLSYDTDATTDYRTDPLSHAVENAWRAGIVVVVSGGNDGRAVHALGNPARNPFVIAAGASSWDPLKPTIYKIPTWSSTGDGLRNPDVLAPGEQIASLRVPGSYLDTTYPAARVSDPVSCTVLFRGSGTSQGAAVTAGAAALLLEQRPLLTPDQIKTLLTSTALSIGKSAEQQGKGMIRVYAAVSAPVPKAVQTFEASNGTGSLELSRGTFHVGSSATDMLVGENHAYRGVFSGPVWAKASDLRTAWVNQVFDVSGRLSSGTWSGSSWSGSSWSGSSWSGSSWSGSSWSGSSWSGSSWSGSSWSGSSWSGSSWSGSSWSGNGWG
jgi:serine protease AprX